MRFADDPRAVCTRTRQSPAIRPTTLGPSGQCVDQLVSERVRRETDGPQAASACCGVQGDGARVRAPRPYFAENTAGRSLIARWPSPMPPPHVGVSKTEARPRRDQSPGHLRRHNVLPPVPPVATQPLPSGGFGTPQPGRETRSAVHVSSKPSMMTTRSARIGAGS
jgi:hypothetical protein